MTSPLPTASLKQLFTEARSHNGFLPKPVSDSTLHALFELFKWGPTSMNCQPARLIFLRTAAARERLIPALSPGNVAKTINAPITVIVAHDSQFYTHLPEQFKAYDARPLFEADRDLADNTAFRNSSLQGAYLMLAARALGLGCGPMSGFDASKVDAEFFPDGQLRTNFLVNLGYGDPSSTYPRGPRLSFEQIAKII